jgi:hypothetical protein
MIGTGVCCRFFMGANALAICTYLPDLLAIGGAVHIKCRPREPDRIDFNSMNALQVIEIFAGKGADGQPVVERLQVRINADDSCQLVRSPAFVKGIASGDTVRLTPGTQEFTLLKRSGNLCIRIFSRADLSRIADNLTPELEMLGGELDIETPRMLVFSIHVSCGFATIEALLNDHVRGDAVWMYGNVYDPRDGVTPLNWWNDILQPE